MQSYEESLSWILAKYCVDENLDIKELPSIRIVENIWGEIENLRPDMTEKLNKDEIDKCSGHTLFLDNETGLVLIDKTFFFDSVRKNLCWVEVLIHEITHYRDMKSNLGIMGHDTYDNMLYCRPFWYWTEFHARYKGTCRMLYYVNKLPDDEREKYEIEMMKTLDRELVFITSDAYEEMRRYHLMHLLGDIAAYNEKGILTQNEVIETIFPDYLGFIEFLKTKDQVVDVDYLTILGRELRQYITINEQIRKETKKEA